jgi:ATP-dependent DNA helicase RecQ
MGDDVVLLVRQLLSGIARCKGKFGVGVVAEVLAGSETERTQKWQLDQLSVYGLLRAHAVKRIIAMLHRLLESGLAHQRDPDGVKFRPVIELAGAGIAVMKGEQLPPAGLADLLPRHQVVRDAPARSRSRAQNDLPEVEIDSAAAARFERLRATRLQIARDRALPPYVICHDATLKQIALHAPTSAVALEQIKGMGPYKVKMYGQAFIDALLKD